MNTLWTFGDSFTDFFEPPKNSKIHWRQKYIEWKGYVPKVYGEIIADKLKMNLINKGLGGCDNSYIFEEFCKVCDLIKQDDIVIIGWTNQQRIRLATKNDSWGFFNPEKRNENGFFSHKSIDSFELLSERTIQEILINRESPLYIKEIGNWIKLINYNNKQIKIIHWGWDARISDIFGLHIKGYKTIKVETNGQVDDGHWCEDGHYELADYFIDKINSNDFLKTKLI